MKSRFVCVLTTTLLVATANATVMSPSNGGNSLLHAIGWQTFDPVTAGNNGSGIGDTTPDSNSTFDATPMGSFSAVTGGGQYLTGTIGSGASVLGRPGFGQTTNTSFLNDSTFGNNTVAPGLSIVDVPLADGTAGTQIGTSAWKFRGNGNQELGDFSITNNSSYPFRLERIHFDARAGAANSPKTLELLYLAGGNSDLQNVALMGEVTDLKVLATANFATQPSEQNISASLSSVLSSATRLDPGATASFRFRWSNLGTDFAESQIDNLALSGTFLDPNNSFAPIDPVAVPEPSGFLLLALGAFALLQARRQHLA